jgi:hypothetical protein
MTDIGDYEDRFDADWEAYADQANKLKELIDKLKENLTSISFDSFYDSFVDTLMDMDSSAQDFANNFTKYLTKSMIDAMVADKYKDKLKDLYDARAYYAQYDGVGTAKNGHHSWAEQNQIEGGLSESELEKLKTTGGSYMGTDGQMHSFLASDAIVKDMMSDARNIQSITGYDKLIESSQNSTSGGYATMSQESADELNGRFTALQIAGENINNTNVVLMNNSNVQLSLSQERNRMLSDMLAQQALMHDALSDIVRFTRPIQCFEGKFDELKKTIKEL